MTITTASLPDAQVGSFYTSPVLAATGGIGPYQWSLTTSSPLELKNDAFTGTPSQSGSFQIGVQVTDSHGTAAVKTLTLNVIDRLSLPPQSLTNATWGVPYTHDLQASGCMGSCQWAADPNSLPLWASFSSAGRLSGTPNVTGTTNISFVVSTQGGATASRTLTLTVEAATLTVNAGGTLPTGMVGAAYPNNQFTASGGQQPYTWTVAGLPPGLTISNGKITGTPTANSQSPYSVTVTATDSNGGTGSATLPITVLNITAQGTGDALPAGLWGQPYSATLTATGGASPYTWSASNLPSGLAISQSGVISGTSMTQVNNAQVQVTIIDHNGRQGSKTYNLTIASSITISGTVRNGSQSTIENATVELWQNSVLLGSVLTGSNGTFSFTGLAGSYTLKVKACGLVFGDISASPSNTALSITPTTSGPTKEYIRLGGQVVAIANCGSQ